MFRLIAVRAADHREGGGGRGEREACPRPLTFGAGVSGGGGLGSGLGLGDGDPAFTGDELAVAGGFGCTAGGEEEAGDGGD
ncbi:MAG: hypothetical protein RI897_2691 [Verrucomicrobiota bacterium]